MDGGAFVQVKIESTSCHRLCLFVWCHWLNHAAFISFAVSTFTHAKLRSTRFHLANVMAFLRVWRRLQTYV